MAQVPDDPQPLGIGFGKNQAALLAAVNGALVRARSSSVASDLFRRLNSYSKQHGLYQAIKAFGQILKSHFILRLIDEPALRMAIERVLNGIEHIHRFTRAVSIWNPRESLQAEKTRTRNGRSVQAAYQELHHLLELSLPIPEAGGDG
jgi:hypothetical protein